MKAHELQASAHKSSHRKGRGISAGKGKTAGRGTKGQKARTGKKISPTFMGGQGALVHRIPKIRGFKSLRAPAQVVYTDQLNDLVGKTADNNALHEAGLVSTPYHTVKVILRGEISGAVTVKVQAASAGAQQAITKAGGAFTKTEVPHYPVSTKKTTDEK